MKGKSCSIMVNARSVLYMRELKIKERNVEETRVMIGKKFSKTVPVRIVPLINELKTMGKNATQINATSDKL